MRVPKFMLAIAASSFIAPVLFGQDTDLLKQLEDKSPKKEYVNYSFKSSRVIMSHSMEVLKPGTMDLRILHRFGNVSQGSYQFFGLDQATMRMGFDFGISRNLMVGVGRSTNKKEFDGFLKYRLIHQAFGPGSVPFSLLLVAGSTLETLKWNDPLKKYVFTDRMGYYYQMIIGRKFSEGISLQLSPTVLHRNLVAVDSDRNDMYAVGAGGRIKLTKRMSVNLDYFYRIHPDTPDNTHNPFSVGFDFETGGHVFQMHFTNAIGMNERMFLSETTNDWGKGDIQFGFNLSRIFQLKNKR